MSDEAPKSSGGESIDPKLAGLLCYLLSVVGGIVFLLISKDKFVRFHAFQSIFLWAAFMIIYVIFIFVPFMFWISTIVWLAFIILEIVMMIKAYQGDKFKLPIIGDLAEKNA